MQQRRLRLVVFEQGKRRHLKGKAVRARKFELRSQPPFHKELLPILAPAVSLRSRADEVVSFPAEARAGRAVQSREHAAERGEVAARPQLEMLEQQIGCAPGEARAE